MGNILNGLDYQKFDTIDKTDDLMNYILEFYETRLMPKEKFIKTCIVLNITFKGLSHSEMIRIVKYGKFEWEKLIAIFKSFFFVYRGYWKVSNELFKKAVSIRYSKSETEYRAIHMEIVDALEPTQNSVRKQEEITSHLYRAKKYNDLKQVLSNIETFLL